MGSFDLKRILNFFRRVVKYVWFDSSKDFVLVYYNKIKEVLGFKFICEKVIRYIEKYLFVYF